MCEEVKQGSQPRVSRFADLLAESFPSIAASPVDSSCLLSKHYHHDRPELDPISEAVEIVDTFGQRGALVRRLRLQHPSGDVHKEQFDLRALDVMTEACAFAWAATVALLGTPSFVDQDGAPDLLCDSGWWVEAKGIHESREESELRRRMLATGEITGGPVQGPGPGLVAKFRSAFGDAYRKFQRQGNGLLAVFFNLTSLDIAQWAMKDDVLADLVRSIDSMTRAVPSTAVTLCYAYDWRRSWWRPDIESPTGALPSQAKHEVDDENSPAL